MYLLQVNGKWHEFHLMRLLQQDDEKFVTKNKKNLEIWRSQTCTQS